VWASKVPNAVTYQKRKLVMLPSNRSLGLPLRRRILETPHAGRAPGGPADRSSLRTVLAVPGATVSYVRSVAAHRRRGHTPTLRWMPRHFVTVTHRTLVAARLRPAARADVASMRPAP
jgi:hypothetical protein